MGAARDLTARLSMDCDIDWCLTCEKRVEGSSPYCSEECQNRAGPSLEPQFYYQQSEQYSSNYDDDDDDLDDDDVIFHSIDASSAQHSSRWLGNDQAGISAWAAEIPAGASAGDSSSPNDDSSSFHSPSTPHFRPPPPNLITPHRRAVPPSLSMTTPPSAPQPPSSPMVTPKRQQSTTSIVLSGYASMGQTSLRTAATESSLATPASSHPVPIISTSRKPSMLEGMYSHVRSWVSPSPALVSTKQRTPLPVLSLDPPTKSTSQLTRSSNLLPVTVISSPHLSHGFPDQSAVCWMAGTVLIDQTAAKLPSFYEQPSRGRTLNSPSPFRHDDHPSFRTRGRKASRAAA